MHRLLGLSIVIGGCALATGEEVAHEELALGLPHPTPPIVVADMAAGYWHNCLVDTCGVVRCWGLNDDGQAEVPAGRYTQVGAGARHSCAIRTSGTIACWGSNRYGQRDAPAGRFVRLDAGENHTCAVRDDGDTVCWGAAPGTAVPSRTRGASTLAVAGQDFSCAQVATTSSVALTCWGQSADGRTSPPSAAFNTYGTPRQTSAGHAHGCVVTGGGPSCGVTGRDGCTGRLLCWGSNASHQIDGTGLSDEDPERAVAFEVESDPGVFLFPASSSGAYGYAQVAAGARHTCAINRVWQTDYGLSTNVLCFGDARSGATTPPAGQMVHLSAGYDHTCGIEETTHQVRCWGSNASRQLDAPVVGGIVCPAPTDYL